MINQLQKEIILILVGLFYKLSMIQTKQLENKIPDTSDLVKKADYNTKIIEIEGNIPDVSSLGTKTALTTVENKIPDVSNLFSNTDYNTKITEIEKKLTNHDHDKYIKTPEFNTLATDVFNARFAQQILIILYQALIIKLL